MFLTLLKARLTDLLPRFPHFFFPLIYSRNFSKMPSHKLSSIDSSFSLSYFSLFIAPLLILSFVFFYFLSSVPSFSPSFILLLFLFFLLPLFFLFFLLPSISCFLLYFFYSCFSHSLPFSLVIFILSFSLLV